jgi:Zn ribbon nucleic-acid-binding protein
MTCPKCTTEGPFQMLFDLGDGLTLECLHCNHQFSEEEVPA